MDYPELAARTRRFTYGAPRAVTVSADGTRVAFLRSSGPEDPVDRLWVYDPATGEERLVADPPELLSNRSPQGAAELPDQERALRERLRLSAAGIGSYATDRAGRVAVFPLAGRLFRADLAADPADLTTGPADPAALTGVPAGLTAGPADPADPADLTGVPADLPGGPVVELSAAGPAVDPRPDPTGQRVAYVTEGTLRIIGPDGSDVMLAGEPDSGRSVTWGLAEFIAAEEFDRYRGYWWSPDGQSILAARVDQSRMPQWYLSDPSDPGRPPTQVAYPYAGSANAEVSLHLLDLDGGWVDVHWDRETYPYLVAVHWSEGSGPLITVLRRLQQHGLVLAVDPRTGETQVHAELADPRWVEPIPGTPCHLGDGRVLVGGELAHDGYDARCLFADGTLLTPPSLYVRRVCGRLAPDAAGSEPTDLLVEASEGEPSEQHLYRVRTSVGSTGIDVRRLTATPGWHIGSAGGGLLVVGSASLDHSGTQWTVYRGGASVGGVAGSGLAQIGALRSFAAPAPYQPRPILERVTDRRLPTGVLYPRQHVAGRRLPVLVDVYGGPGHQEVLSARSRWTQRQWWADTGFAVVVVDNRGTPGVAPSFEKVVHRRLADLILADQVEALAALATKHPDLDLERVAIRGGSFGGWLAALAVLRRPDVYRCGIAGAPVSDWGLYDTAYTERYLGLPDDSGEVYGHHCLIGLASEPPAGPDEARPLLLIHGMSDDNVVAAHTLRLSAALLAAGRPHAVLPLSGATHLLAGGVRDRMLPLELDFLRRNLPDLPP